MAATVRLARRRLKQATELAQQAQVASVLNERRAVWRINLLDGAGKTLELRTEAYGRRQLFRGNLSSAELLGNGTPSVDAKALAARALPEPNTVMADDEELRSVCPGQVLPMPLASSSALAVREDLPRLCHRLRRMPLQRLASTLPLLQELVQQQAASSDVAGVSAAVWAAVARRVLANAAKLPLEPLAHALTALQLHGHLSSSVAQAQVIKALARHADSQAKLSAKGLSLGSLLHCCRIVKHALEDTKLESAGLWAGRLHGALSRQLPPMLPEASTSQTISWLEFYADQGLVDGKHLLVWEAAGTALQKEFLSREEELRLQALQGALPLWVTDCLPPLSSQHGDSAEKETEQKALLAASAWQPELAGSSLLATNSTPATTSSREVALSPPMYQTSPPVPVLWHVSPENYQRGLTRMGASQLVLALRYTAADGVGLFARGAAQAEDPAATRALASNTNSWPRRHRSRTRAQAFVAALLVHLRSRIRGVNTSEACSAVKSLASLQSLAVAPGPEAAEALRALLSGPLAGWKVATALTPRDVALLLDGLSGLASGPELASYPDELRAEARQALRCGAATRLLALTACALQEAGAPPSTLRSLCASAAGLAVWQRAEGLGRLDSSTQRSLFDFLRAAGTSVRDTPKVSGLRQPLAVLRAAGNAQLWSSDTFPMLAPMVISLLCGATKPVAPGQLPEWRLLLPRAQEASRGQGKLHAQSLMEMAQLFAGASQRRPLEGEVATAFCLNLLMQLPLLRASLARSADALQLSCADYEAMLLYSANAVSTLRHAAEARPSLAPVLGIGSVPLRGRPAPAVERFDPDVLEDARLAVQILRSWQKLRLACPTGHEGERPRARKRKAKALAEDRARNTMRDSMDGYLAMVAYEHVMPWERAALMSAAKRLLMQACLRRDGPDAAADLPARAQVRSWLRCTRQHCSVRTSQVQGRTSFSGGRENERHEDALAGRVVIERR